MQSLHRDVAGSRCINMFISCNRICVSELLCVPACAQNVDSEKKVTVDGEELGKGKEKKLGIGMKIKFGDDSEWQVRCCALSACSPKGAVSWQC